jgi:hypothetical protein
MIMQAPTTIFDDVTPNKDVRRSMAQKHRQPTQAANTEGKYCAIRNKSGPKTKPYS